MKYKVTKPFIAFGMAPEAGEELNLNAEQAQALLEARVVTPYEVKVAAPVENKAKKPSGSSRLAPRSRRKTAKRSGKIVTK